MILKFLISFSAFASFIYSNAQDSTSKGNLTISGSVDAYYRYNFHNAKDSAHTNNYTSFTNSQNSFELGMASIKGDYSIGKVDGVLDLGFGKRAEEFSYNDSKTMAAIKQAYVSFAPSDKVKFTMGKWATHVGYELLDAYLNRNYSMDYMFSYGPFSHTGLKADIGLGGKSALMFGVATTSDMVATTLSRKLAIAQFSTGSSNDKIKAYLNYQGTYGGSYSLTQFDLVVTAAVTD